MVLKKWENLQIIPNLDNFGIDTMLVLGMHGQKQKLATFFGHHLEQSHNVTPT